MSDATRDSRPSSALRRFIDARMDPDAALGLYATVGLVVSGLALWLFGALIEELLDNATLVRLDVAASAAIRARETAGGMRAFGAITQLGSPVVLGALAAIGALILWRRRHRTTLVIWVAAFAGGLALNETLKRVIHRTRPVQVSTYLHGQSFSFPSGHAMGSTIGYGLIAYVLARGLFQREHARRVHPAVAYAIAAAIVLLVGLSRIYLGVHYPVDVIGGFAAGGAWLAVCLTAAGIARRRSLVASVRHTDPGATT